MRSFPSTLCAVFALATSLASTAGAQVQTQGAQSTDPRVIATRIDSLVAAALQRGPVAAFSVAVVRGRDTITMKGYGMADLENDVAATPATVYRIGSVTKQFTSAAVMQLVEQGKISLDDDITKYLPNTPVHGRKVLVRHLLNHTSGIPSYTDVGNRFGRVMRMDLARDTLVGLVANDSLMFEPGSHFYYNNTGYYLLGMLIEKVTGKPYGAYLQETLFTPLGLSGTRYCSTTPLIKHRAQGYDVRNGQLTNTDYISMELPYAAGSLCSTVGDLVKWTTALSSGKVVKPDSYRQMTTPVALTSGRPMSYGFGLGAGKLESHRMISHGGGINGFISSLEYFPDDSLTVAVLANTSPAPSDRLASDIARVVLGLPFAGAPPVAQALPTPADVRAKFVGDYDVVQPDGTKRPARVLEEGEQLKIQLGGGTAARLLRQSDNVFTAEGIPGMRVVFDLKNGKAVGFQLDRGARSLEGTRR